MRVFMLLTEVAVTTPARNPTKAGIAYCITMIGQAGNPVPRAVNGLSPIARMKRPAWVYLRNSAAIPPNDGELDKRGAGISPTFPSADPDNRLRRRGQVNDIEVYEEASAKAVRIKFPIASVVKMAGISTKAIRNPLITPTAMETAARGSRRLAARHGHQLKRPGHRYRHEGDKGQVYAPADHDESHRNAEDSQHRDTADEGKDVVRGQEARNECGEHHQQEGGNRKTMLSCVRGKTQTWTSPPNTPVELWSLKAICRSLQNATYCKRVLSPPRKTFLHRAILMASVRLTLYLVAAPKRRRLSRDNQGKNAFSSRLSRQSAIVFEISESLTQKFLAPRRA